VVSPEKTEPWITITMAIASSGIIGLAGLCWNIGLTLSMTLIH